MSSDTPEGNEDNNMGYSDWLNSGNGVGSLIVNHARQALDRAIQIEQDDEYGAGRQIDTLLGRFLEIHRQCARWKVLATMENMFRVYPGLVKSVGALVELPIDGHGGCALRVNDEIYEPGDINEFCMETMQAMEDVDGLVAINLASDALVLLCGCEHPAEESEQVEALAVKKTRAQMQGLMATEAPELNSRVQSLWMKQDTALVVAARRPMGRM